MADLKITDEIRGIINQCRFDGNKVYLPDIQLDRKLYTQINTLFSELKGVWNRKEKAHIFPSDPREGLGVLAAQDKLIDQKKLFQSFFTPPDVAKRVVELAEIEPHHIILEPSCGIGALVNEINKVKHLIIDVCEINEEFLNTFKAKRYPTISYHYNQDFLTLKISETYDRVVMNSPFNKGQWISHIQHAYKFLKPGGKLVAITPDSLNNKKFQDFVADKKWEFEPVEAGAFSESGTNIATNIITIWK